LTVKLRADYKNSNGELKTAYLDIRLKDGYCVCPAKIGANTLLNFMCHNLGGLDIISSDQIITRAHHGGYYRFGAKDPSYDNVVDNLSSLGWTASTPYVQSGGTEWRDDHNPCPAGWKLPTGTQWGAFTNYYNANSGETFPFPVSTWIEDPSGSSVVDNGKRFGVHLYLPVSGARHIDGALFRRGYHGSYWSSTSDSTDKGYRMFFGYSNQMFGEDYRYFAGNVRCVSE
jgi:uncharacterized protein (TIGR02145 family)